MPLNLFINEPDIYSSVYFENQPEFGSIYRPGDEFDPASVEAICISLKDVIDDKYLKDFPNLKYIVSNTTAVDHIKTSRPVQIIHLDSLEIQNITATAEFTLALMLSLVRKIPFINSNKPDKRLSYRGMQLNGKILGIFGFGRLGKLMSGYAESLKMDWISFDKNDSLHKKFQILKESDIITIHLPLAKETIGFFGGVEFDQMEKKPYLINTSRPQIINKPALLNALDTGQISGAAMDFINYDANFEWDLDLKKYTDKNLLLTPHIAGNTYESVSATAKIVVNKLAKRLSS
jgi:D-3-phosphoglycerate dehydrogenase